MANKWKGTFDVELGGVTYQLRPSFDAMVEFEDKTGMSVGEAQALMAQEGHLSFKIIAAAIWAGILGECIATNREGDVVPYRVVGQKIKIDGLQNFAFLATKFLTYSIIPEDTINKIEEELDIKEDEKKSANTQADQ